MKDLYMSMGELYNLDVAFPNINNAESILYNYNNHILKIFNTINPYDLNRFKVRILFWQKKKYDFLINPEFFVYVDDEFKGFGMNRYSGKNIKDHVKSLSYEDKLNILKLFSKTLKNAHDNGVIIGDLNCGNVLTDGSDIKFCDINSMGFHGSFSPLMIPCTLERNMNISEYDKGTIKSDIFLINAMILNLLITDQEFPFYLNVDSYINNYMNHVDLPKDIYEMFIHIYDIFNESDPLYPHEYLDSLKDYKRTRKKF